MSINALNRHSFTHIFYKYVEKTNVAIGVRDSLNILRKF